MTEFCFICHCPATISDIQTHFCTESATISGKSILNIAIDILALSDIDVTSITCQLCYEIVDEIDAFDHSLAQAKQKLQDRYEPKLRLQDNNDEKCVSFPYNYYFYNSLSLSTGKSLSEAYIFVSTNPQYEDRLFIELQVQCMKIPSSEHVVYINCSECQNKKTICVHNMF